MTQGKKKTAFFCRECGNESAKWLGRCPACGSWNSLVEEPVTKTADKTAVRRTGTRPRPTRMTEISLEESQRSGTGLHELDRVLGGGIVKGSLVLIGGDPGIGKSTLLLQVCRNLTFAGQKVLYVSGEESGSQIRMRGKRLGAEPENLLVLCETSLSDIRQCIEEEMPQVCVIDSIQTMWSEEVSAAPGSVSQVRESTNVLMGLAKGLGISIFIVGHVTKEGAVAGPRVLEHMVDTVLYFEGDRHASYRILRAVKNRFGSTDEIGVFEMRAEGLAEVKNPSEYMLEGRPENASGSVVTCSLEGSRPLLLEVQALVARSSFGLPRRTAAGCDVNRVNLLLAVLEKRCGMDLSSSDAYINIAGGIRANEPAVDLGILLALASGYRDFVIPEDTVAFGEVGLSGEIRSVSQAELRVQEAARLGLRKVILPAAGSRKVKAPEGVALVRVSTAKEAIAAAQGRFPQKNS